MPRTSANPAPVRARSAKPTVAIIGRPNVGKSTLFNRLIGARHAIVEDTPGTTRDRLYGESEWKDSSFTLIDTGGLELDVAEGYSALIRAQVATALGESDVILFLVDVTFGVTSADVEIAELLRRTDKPVLLLANKADNTKRRAAAVEFFELALGEPMAISAHHDDGIRDLRDRLLELLPPAQATADLDQLKLAIVGRPNVGKSAIINAILGQERVIVSPEAGTTRDAVDTEFRYKDHQLTLVDTAGIRRRGRVERGVETYSVMRARQAIERCDIAILVLDATQNLAAQDMHVGGYVADAHKGMIIAVNKWDLMDDSEDNRNAFADRVLRRMRFTAWAPLAFVSAETRLNIEGLLDLALEVSEARSTRLPTARVNAVLREAVAAHPPSSAGKRPLRIKYATQVEIRPPTFVFFANDASLLHFSYKRYLENTLRKRFGFEGTAIKLEFRSRSG